MVPNGDLDAFLEVNLDQNRSPNQLFGKSADMRLDRAGSIGLRVGPLQIAPKIQKTRVRNPTLF